MEGKQEGLWLPLHGLFVSWKASANGKLPYFLFASFLLFRPSCIAPSSLLPASSFLSHLQPFPVIHALSFEAPYVCPPPPILQSTPASSSLGDGDTIFRKAPIICSRNRDSSQSGFSEGWCPHAVACCTRTPQSVTRGTPLVRYKHLISTETFLLYHTYKLGREGVNRDEGENEREIKEIEGEIGESKQVWGDFHSMFRFISNQRSSLRDKSTYIFINLAL